MKGLLSEVDEVEALVSLRTDPRFLVLLRGISNTNAEYTRQLIYTNDREQAVMLQGLIRGLTEVLKATEEAPKRLHALRQPRT